MTETKHKPSGDVLLDRVNGYLDAARTLRESPDPLERETAKAWLDSFYGRQNKVLYEDILGRIGPRDHV